MTSRTPKRNCLNCGYTCDAVSGIDNEGAPSPGDISLCFKCGALMKFANDLTLRGFTDQEMEEILADAEYIRFLARHVRGIHVFQASKG